MKRKAFQWIAVSLCIAVLTGCGNPFYFQANTTEKAGGEKDTANKEALAGARLNVLVSYHEDMVKRLAEMYEAETGCKVSYIRIPTGEAVTRLLAEQDDPTFHVYIGGTVEAHENLKNKNVLVPYFSPIEKELEPQYVDPEGVWKAQYIETLSIGINTQRWEEEFPNKKMPSSLADLLSPEFKGKIIVPDPLSSGTGYTFLSSVIQLMGEEKGWEYITEFNKQVGQYTTSGYSPAEKVGLGQYLICVNFLSDQTIVRDSGYPIESIVYDKAGWTMCPVSIVSGSQDNIAARNFIDFCIQKPALDALVELGTCVAVREDCIAPDGGSGINELVFNREYSPVEAALQKDELLEQFKNSL